MIISFCGIDGAGKSSLIELTEKELKNNGYSVFVFKSVSSKSLFCKQFEQVSCYYKKKYMRNIPTNYSSILLAFKLFQDSQFIDKIKDKFDFILLDRWVPCHKAFSRTYLTQSDLLDCILESCINPDLTFIVNTDINTSQRRILERGSIKKQESFYILYRAQKYYLEYSKNKNCYLIENEDDKLNEAKNKIIKIVLYEGVKSE